MQTMTYTKNEHTPEPRDKFGTNKLKGLPISVAIRNFIFPVSDLTTEQLHVYAVCLGVLGTIVAYIYDLLLHYVILFLWVVLPSFLAEKTTIFDVIPMWLWNVLIPSVMGALVGCLIKYLPSQGSVPDMLTKLHDRGWIGGRHFLSMLIISTVSISAGGSAGPEASVLVMMASLSGKLVTLLFPQQTRRTKRVLSLCAMAAGLSAFFGLPVGGALFVLELPHRMGLQYYEAITPAMMSSLVSVLILKFITGESLSGKYLFPSIPVLHAWDMVVGAILGLFGGLVAIIFILIMRGLKKLLAAAKLSNSPVVLATLGGIGIGWIAALYPQTLFWSEGQMQNMLDLGVTPLPYNTVPGAYNITTPYSTKNLTGIFFGKMGAIMITLAAGWPGGIIYPLFYAGATLGQIVANVFPQVKRATAVMCLMGALEVAATRTPWATSMIILVVHQTSQTDSINVVGPFIVVTVACYVSLFTTRKVPYLSNLSQHSRPLADFWPLYMSPARLPITEEAHEKLKAQKSGHLQEIDSTTPLLSADYNSTDYDEVVKLERVEEK